jgi:DNA invertase Pin-like site-specific DNA recombinase
MATGNFIAYYRVSTRKQGASGLGLEAQQRQVEAYLNGGNWKLVGEFTEVESGRKNGRPQLDAALKACSLRRAKLVIAKLDRLSRNASFLLKLRDDGVDFVAADMPDANRLTVGILALIAENEAEAISARTKAALQAAKARGVKLGGDRGGRAPKGSLEAARRAYSARANAHAAKLVADIAELQATGATTLQAIADGLNAREITTARGGQWSATQVSRVLKRI